MLIHNSVSNIIIQYKPGNINNRHGIIITTILYTCLTDIKHTTCIIFFTFDGCLILLYSHKIPIVQCTMCSVYGFTLKRDDCEGRGLKDATHIYILCA